MATVSAKVYEHHKKTDGTYNVKIRVFHRDEKKFIDTSHFVTRRQLDADFNIKDKFLNKILEDQLSDYRKEISGLGSKLNYFTAETLRDYLRDKDADIDFIAFCVLHIERLKKEKRKGSADNHKTVKNSLIDFFKRDSVSVTEINSGMLLAFERFLKTERVLIRKDQFGNETKTVKKAITASGLFNYMRDLRTLFNEARKFYNNEDLGIYRIKHYPFKKYKVGSAPLTKKRKLTVEQVLAIRDCPVRQGSRAELARDLFMLSFYLCGMNAVDLYQLGEITAGQERLEYNRSKTGGQRKDHAFISIKIIEEASPLLGKYAGRLQQRYSSHENLNHALKKGMKELQKLAGVPEFTFYWARHTFANLARNTCRISKDDIAEALNHVDEGHKTTDIYIERDWRIVDEVQEKVILLLIQDKVIKPESSSFFIERRSAMKVI